MAAFLNGFVRRSRSLARRLADIYQKRWTRRQGALSRRVFRHSFIKETQGAASGANEVSGFESSLKYLLSVASSRV